MTEPAKPSLLLVDDDPLIADTLSFVLSRSFQVRTAASRAQAINAVRQASFPPSLAVIDLGLPPLPHQPDEGFALIADLLQMAPRLSIFVLSGQNEEAHARHARTLGAVDFLAKPFDPALLEQTLLRASCLSAESVTPQPDGLVGESAAMQLLREQVRQLAKLSFPVLVSGESGTGKELIARSLHAWGKGDTQPWYACNCAAISASLLEATLFGHGKGAFTGATAAKTGYFEEAGQGTLFLDEIGEMPLEAQAKLLRVLENGEFQRVGETQTRLSRARVVAATNRDLRREVREGRFRQDLYHRLSVFHIVAPALRELDEDKLRLLDCYRDRYALQLQVPPFELSPEALASWRGYSFPGNVRELRNMVIRLLSRYPGQTVGAAQLAAELEPTVTPEPSTAAWPDVGAAMRELQANPSFRLDRALQVVEQCYIDAALRLTQGNMSQAAKLLGVNRSTLYGRVGQDEST